MLSSSLGQLKHLELGYNLIRRLNGIGGPPQDREGCLNSLEELNLEGNELADWSNVVDSLGHLPAYAIRTPAVIAQTQLIKCLSPCSLSRLVLSGNRISSLSAPPTKGTPRLTQLRHLSLASNLLSAWPALDPLNDLPALESLTLADNPLVANEEEEKGGVSRLLVIGRVRGLTQLENSPVRGFERDDAERFYLAAIAKEVGLKTDEEREKVHPRFTELVQSECALPREASLRAGADCHTFCRAWGGGSPGTEADDAESAHP